MNEECHTTARAVFPYCTRHNRLYPHPTVGWLTPAKPQELQTLQAFCDECRQETVCNLVHSSQNTSALGVVSP